MVITIITASKYFYINKRTLKIFRVKQWVEENKRMRIADSNMIKSLFASETNNNKRIFHTSKQGEKFGKNKYKGKHLEQQ